MAAEEDEEREEAAWRPRYDAWLQRVQRGAGIGIGIGIAIGIGVAIAIAIELACLIEKTSSRTNHASQFSPKKSGFGSGSRVRAEQPLDGPPRARIGPFRPGSQPGRLEP